MLGSINSTRCMLVTMVAVLAARAAIAQEPNPGFADPLLGRWDIEVGSGTVAYPSWLEVRLRTENEIMGRFVGRFGSVRYVSVLRYDAGHLVFEAPVQYERRSDALPFEGWLDGNRLEGTTLDEAGHVLRWSGTRAPALRRADVPAWGEPVRLLNDEVSSGWRPRSSLHAGCWRVADGILASTPPCVDLISERVFDDFKLHFELRYPAGSNSGVYLRGRYEVQIQDDAGKALDPLRMGAVYGFLSPALDAARGPDEWQSLDVTLLGRDITVVLNGVTIIDGRAIPGITGGALDSREGEPGPIMLQGDHGPIEFRNIVLTPARSAR